MCPQRRRVYQRVEEKAKVLVVDDDERSLRLLEAVLMALGYEVILARDGREALEKVRKTSPDVILLDIMMPGIDGVKVLRRIKKINEASSVIMITAHGTMETVLESIKLGAYDYLTKPLDLGKVEILVRRALEAHKMAQEVRSLRSDMQDKYQLGNIIGKHPKMFKVYNMIARVADNKATVLIIGETGSGKEVVARVIHFNGFLKDRPFVAVDCACLSSDLVESELFGHEKGAFTGAITQKIGKLELANKGTLFLDEVGNLTLTTQAKLLRFLQEKKIERVGGVRPIELDIRIIAATNLDLERAVQEGSFRKDLYHRLNVVVIHVPPLRERRDDIPLLAEHFLEKFKSESKGKVKYVPPETMDLLMRYQWPGNVRELENVIERAIVIGNSDAILLEDLPMAIQKPASGLEPDISSDQVSLKQKMENFEKKLILDTLKKANWIQMKAAHLLGTSHSTIGYKMKKYGIKREYVQGSPRGQSSKNQTGRP